MFTSITAAASPQGSLTAPTTIWSITGPKINQAGQITWLEQAQDGTYRVVLYHGSTPTYLGNGRHIDTPPRLNNLEQVVWVQDDGSVPDGLLHQVYLFDGSTTRQITFDNHNKCNACINDQGDLLWAQASDAPNLWELVLYRYESKIFITTEMGVNQPYGLNAQSQAFWLSGGQALYYYNGGVNTFVVFADKTAGLGFNDMGQLAYNATAGDLWFYDGRTNSKTLLDGRHYYRSKIQMNNRGQIVYAEGFTAYLLNPRIAAPAINFLLLD